MLSDQKKRDNNVIVFFKGILLGIISLGIPGVSASTIGIIVGIYFFMVEAIANIFKEFRKNIFFLLSLIMGYAVGAVGASFFITFLFDLFPYVITFSILGIILGAIVNTAVSLQGHFNKLSNWLTFLGVFLFLGAYNLFLSSDAQFSFPTEPDLYDLILMFFIGLFTSATFIIPGIDFAVVFMSLGIYYPFMNMIKDLFAFTDPNYLTILIANGKILGFYLVGYFIGIFLFSKLIKFLMQRFEYQLQFAAFAFVVAAPPVFLNSCIITNEATRGMHPAQIIIGGVLSLLFAIAMMWFDYRQRKKSAEPVIPPAMA
jgi:putative membrane protein